MSHWVIVGISGVTNGGKSTLTKRLAEQLPGTTRVLNQDDYFYPTDSPHHIPCPGGLSHHNWDVITSIDMCKMMKDIRKIVESDQRGKDFTKRDSPSSLTNHISRPATGTRRSVLLLDGYVLFGNTQLAGLCDLRYFLTLTREQCWKRRRTRVYDPPDPPGYFDLCVWPMYEAHLKYVCESVPNTIFLDGMEDHFPTVYREVVAASTLPPSPKSCRLSVS